SSWSMCILLTSLCSSTPAPLLVSTLRLFTAILPPQFPGHFRPLDSSSNPQRASTRRTGRQLLICRRPTTVGWNSLCNSTRRNATFACASCRRKQVPQNRIPFGLVGLPDLLAGGIFDLQV